MIIFVFIQFFSHFYCAIFSFYLSSDPLQTWSRKQPCLEGGATQKKSKPAGALTREVCAGGHLLDVGLGHVVEVLAAQEAGGDVGAVVEGLAVEGRVVRAQLGTPVLAEDVLVDGVRVGQDGLAVEPLVVGRVVL